MIINGYGKDSLCPLLSDNVFIKICLDVRRLGKTLKAKFGGFRFLHRLIYIVGNDAHAKLNTLITNVCAVAGNESACLILRFAAK